MALSIDQVRETFKSPKNKANIQKASQYEKRLNFHVETAMDRSDVSHACNVFLGWVQELIPKDKFLIFLSLFRFPVSTNDLTEKIFSSLQKVFDGRDPFYDYQFTNSQAKDDYQAYKKEVLGGNGSWNEESFKVMMNAINSIMIVDLPMADQSNKFGNLPEPFYRFKKIGSFHDYELYDEDNMHYVMYMAGKELLVVIDDEGYKMYSVIKNTEIGEELLNEPHELEYCPAKFFWSDNLKDSNPSLKKSPLSNQLTNLDKLLRYTIDKDHLDMYAAYPIVYMINIDCDYKTPMGHEDDDMYAACDSGYMKDEQGRYMIDNTGSVAKCPVCGERRFAGPGSIVETPMPDAEEGVPALNAPVGIVSIDLDSLEYNVSRIDSLENKIYTNVAGQNIGIPTNQAVNPEQIAAAMESMTTALRNLKKPFEKAQEWAERTICTLRYSSVFQDLSFNYGTTFYFMTVQDLLSLYKSAKDAGASDTYLDSIQEQIIETQHKNNPIEANRAKIIMELEPYRHMTKSEVFNLFQKNPDFINPVDLAIKMNFSNFIARFERENLPIQEFGINTSHENKINSIRKTLEVYGNYKESTPGQEPVEGE